MSRCLVCQKPDAVLCRLELNRCTDCGPPQPISLCKVDRDRWLRLYHIATTPLSARRAAGDLHVPTSEAHRAENVAAVGTSVLAGSKGLPGQPA